MKEWHLLRYTALCAQQFSFWHINLNAIRKQFYGIGCRFQEWKKTPSVCFIINLIDLGWQWVAILAFDFNFGTVNEIVTCFVSNSGLLLCITLYIHLLTSRCFQKDRNEYTNQVISCKNVNKKNCFSVNYWRP